MHTIGTAKMKPSARLVLNAAHEHHQKLQANGFNAGWFRPRAIGGTATNRYASLLGLLVRRGFIERRDAAPGGMREARLWEYRITNTGIMALGQGEEHRGGWYGAQCHGQ